MSLDQKPYDNLEPTMTREQIQIEQQKGQNAAAENITPLTQAQTAPISAIPPERGQNTGVADQTLLDERSRLN